MDVSYFLGKRLDYIEYYFQTCTDTFLGEMSAIENGAPPYDDPPYSEGPEPAYLEEWLRANDALETLGRSCISMLAKLATQYVDYLFKRQIGITFDTEAFKKEVKKSGIAPFYRDALLEIYPSLETANIDFDVIEAVILIRNRDQHEDEFLGNGIKVNTKMTEKPGVLKFVSLQDLSTFQETQSSWCLPHITVNRESFSRAVNSIRDLAVWLDAHEHEMRAWRRREFP